MEKQDSQMFNAYKEISKQGHFKNKKDENAFLGLARIYLGRDAVTAKPSESATSMKKRKERGNNFFEATVKDATISQEAKTRIAQLYEAFGKTYQGYSKERAELRKRRVAKTINRQMNGLEQTYHPNVTKKISALKNAYLGLDSEGKKLNKENRTVEKRYETADKILIKMGKLTEGEKMAVIDLSNVFKAYDQRDYDRRSSGRDSRTRKLDARRDALRIQYAKTTNYALENIVDHVKVETALERTTQDPKQKKGFMQYINETIKKPWGKVAAVGLGLAVAGLLTYGALRGCDRKQPIAPLMVEKKVAEMPERERFTPDPFKPVPEIEEALKGKRERCIDWQKSKLEQQILSYKLKDGIFKAKLGKDIAEAMRKDPGIVFRFIGDGKLYETNKVGPNGEIEISGITYKTGAQFGIIKKAEGNCGDYLASLRVDKPKEVVAAPEVKKPVITPTPRIEEKVKKPVEKKKEYKVEIKEKKPAVEKKVEPRIEIKKPREILTSLTKTTIDYRKVWSPFVGCYDHVKDFNTEEAKSLYEELTKAFKERSPEYMFLDRTPKSARGAVPKLIAEFSSYEREKRLEKMLEEEDMNTLKNVTIVNFEPTRGNNRGYDYLIMLKGTPEEKAAQAVKRITEELTHMKEKGHFDTYFWERDVKKKNPSAEAPVQGNLFIKGNGQNKAIGAIFTPEGTEVKLVRDNAESVEERLANDEIRIGKPMPKTLGGDGEGPSVADAGAGSIGGGPM